MSNLEIFNLENFVLHYNSILCFCNPRNIYHKNTESHESTKILTLEIFRLYGMSVFLVSIVIIIISASLGLTVIVASYFSISSVGLVLADIMKLNTLVVSFADIKLK